MRIDKILVECKLPRENFIKIMLCEALEGDPLTMTYELSFFLDVNYERHELDTNTLARGLWQCTHRPLSVCANQLHCLSSVM